MKMYDENATSEDIQEQIDNYSYCLDRIEEVILGLNENDKDYNKEYIKTLKEIKTDFENEIEGLEEERDEKIEEEQKEHKAEMREMNCVFERSRL